MAIMFWGDKILFDNGLIAMDSKCCCLGGCCGRHMPGGNKGVNEYPRIMYVTFYKVECLCPAVNITFTLTWDSIEFAWVNNAVNMADCFSSRFKLTCVSNDTFKGFSGSWLDINPCVVDGANSVVLEYPGTCFPDLPVDGLKEAVVSGIGCCGHPFGSHRIGTWIHEKP